MRKERRARNSHRTRNFTAAGTKKGSQARSAEGELTAEPATGDAPGLLVTLARAASIWLRRDPAASNSGAITGDLLGPTVKGPGEDAAWRAEQVQDEGF